VRELEADGLIRNARFVTEAGRTFLEYEPLDVSASHHRGVEARGGAAAGALAGVARGVAQGDRRALPTSSDALSVRD